MKVLVTDRYPTETLLPLSDLIGAEVIRAQSHQPSEEELQNSEALLIRSRTSVNAKLLSRAKRLKVVVSATSGFDHIELKLCQEKGVQVSYTPNANAQSAAELTLFLILGGLRKMALIRRAQEKGLWKDQIEAGFELKKKTIGIIGFGRVGRTLAQLLKPFQTRLLVYDPYLEAEAIHDSGGEKTNLTELFRSSDILSLHAPLTAETRQMISASSFEEMGSDTLLVNAARGALVNEVDLLQGLEEGRILGAALDVFGQEPLSPSSPLRLHPKIFWTPHIGAMTDEALRRASSEAVEKLIRWTQGGRLDDELPGSIPWLK